jgi:DNA-binding CsgD family transcriptional regulator
MVGRATELGALIRAWSRVSAGGAGPAHSVIITGSAGAGKSLLLASALTDLDPPPRIVLSGTARVHTPAPYDWLAAVLNGRDLTPLVSSRELAAPPDALAWLAQHHDAPTERYAPGALLRLAVRVVRALIGGGPGVIVVEDLHALDPASLNLIGELAVAPDLPALVLVTSQPPDSAVSPQLVARTLARLTGAPGANRLHLQPLGVGDVAAILARVYGTVAPEVADAVWRRTGGNPYRLSELLATRGRDGLAALAAVPPDRPSDTGTDLTAREVEVLSCIAAGMSNKQVARSLGISVRTVTVHVSNLLRKTRSASRTEAALWAVQHRVVRAVYP